MITLFRSLGCGSLLLGILFILLVLTLAFGWEIEGKYYGVGCTSQGVRIIWGGDKNSPSETEVEEPVNQEAVDNETSEIETTDEGE